MRKRTNALKSYLRDRRAGIMASLLLLVVTTICAPSAEAQTRLIVRDSLGLPGPDLTCLIAGCKVVTGLEIQTASYFL